MNSKYSCIVLLTSVNYFKPVLFTVSLFYQPLMKKISFLHDLCKTLSAALTQVHEFIFFYFFFKSRRSPWNVLLCYSCASNFLAWYQCGKHNLALSLHKHLLTQHTLLNIGLSLKTGLLCYVHLLIVSIHNLNSYGHETVLWFLTCLPRISGLPS